MDSVSTILTTLDAAITSAGRKYFEATAGAVGPIYTTLLALLLVMVGINAALNVYRISMREPVIWLHAVSVGETRACAPLLQALLDAHPYEVPAVVAVPTHTVSVAFAEWVKGELA